MTDDKILDIVPKLIKRITYHSIVLSNKEYNERYSSDVNMNKIKAIMHNKALFELVQKNLGQEYIVVDEFAKPGVYFHYLKGVPNVIRDITFMTKGEDKCLSVACASLISRYIFIGEFDKLGDSLGVFLPKGASDVVDEMGVKIATQFGFGKLKECAKLNFKNTGKIQNMLQKKQGL